MSVIETAPPLTIEQVRRKRRGLVGRVEAVALLVSSESRNGTNKGQPDPEDTPPMNESNVVYISPEEVDWPEGAKSSPTSGDSAASGSSTSAVEPRCVGGTVARIGLEACPNGGNFEVTISLSGIVVGNYSFDGDVYKHQTSWQGSVPGALGALQRFDLTFYFDSTTDVAV